MLDPTTVDDSTPPSDSTDQPSQESTDTVESLKAKLAAEQKAKLEAEEEAKRWKNRVKEENPPKKKVESEEDYADWRIDNKDRISLVRDQYEKELIELQESGMKITNAAREKALKLAELTVGVKKADPSEALPSPSVDRSGTREPIMTEYDNAFRVKPETKKKYANLEKEWM
jgi:hypothetical protein